MQISADRPRFRQDLVAEPIEDGDARFIDVMDPDSGQLFRFYEVEYSLACAMDGQRDIAGIVKWAEEELGLKPSANEVRTVIATLGDLGYLERGADAAAAASAPMTEPAAPAHTPATARAAPAPPTSPPPRPRTPPAGVPTSRPATPPAGVPTAAPSTPPSDTPAVKKQPEAPAFNRWDQPTAMGDSDDYLDQIAAAKAGSNVELGAPGARGAGASDELPRAPELELGAPGSSAAAAATKQRGDDIALGASGASNVSTDLADVPVRRDDVKDAVRAAHGDATAEAKTAAKAEPAAQVETKPVESKPAEKPVDKPVEAKPAETKKKPTEMPTDRPVLPKAPPAPSSGVSPILIGLLVLVILGAGGFLVYKYVLKKDSGATSATAPEPAPQPPEPPPPAPVETAKLALEQPEPQEIKPTVAGQLASIVATDTAVKAGEPIARLVGFQPVQNQINALQKEIDKATADIAKLESDRDAAAAADNTAAATAAETKLAAAQKTLAERAAKLATQTTALDKFLIKAPVDGKVTPVAKANARVTPTDIIATLTPDPVLVATFTSAGEAATDAKVLLAVKDGEQKLACTVVESGEDGVKIACPQQDGASEGAEVTFAGLDPSAIGDGDGAPDEAPPAPAAPADKPVEPATGESAPADDDAPAGAVAPKAVAPRAPARPVRRPQAQPQAPTEKSSDLFPPADEPAPAPAPAPQ